MRDIFTPEQIHNIAMESLLDRLFALTIEEKERTLSEEENEFYTTAWTTLVRNNIEIPFGVEI